MPDFWPWPFPVNTVGYTGTNTTISRTMPVRLSEFVNVKEWGALGNTSANDAPAIQAAINFCIFRGGGKVFFPPGQYTCLTNLIVGSDTNSTAFVQLVGGGGGSGSSTKLLGPGSGWLVSKGTKLYDLIQRVEGLGFVGGIKITGQAVQIKNCNLGGLVMVDASQANGAVISDCAGSGGEGTNDSGGPKVFSSVGVGLYLGNNCMATNCRLMGSNWITYALSGTGASVVGCSTETTYTAVRVGWAPDADASVIGGGRELAAIGCTVIGLQTERQTVTIDLFNAVGCYIAGNAVTGGHGTPNDHPITNMSYSGGLITATTIANHNLPTGVSKLLLNVQQPDGVTLPIPWRPSEFTPCTNSAPNQFTYAAGDPGYPFSGAISNMTWASNVVTVTIPNTGTALPVNMDVSLSNISGTWNPGATNPTPVLTVPFTVRITSSTPTSFTYAGPTASGSGDQVGNWDRSPGVGWAYPGLFGIRCRKVSECLIIANQVTTNSSIASVDLQYGAVPLPYNQTTPGEAVHANNVFIGLSGQRGWLPPSAQNAAGWRFINCGVTGLLLGSNPSASITPVGSLTFANLPGQFSDPTFKWQGGPFDAQEYDISDGSKFGFTPPTAAAWGDQVIAGGNGHYKVRYDVNSGVWRRIG